MLVSEVMEKKFHVLRPDLSVAQAVYQFRQASEAEGRKIFGMVVADDQGRLLGMLSMYDILLFVRPKHVAYWGEMDDILPSGILDQQLDRLKTVYVADLMTTGLISISPATHVLAALDIMLKKHIRRLPVVEEDKLEGILYISDLFYGLLDKFLEQPE